MRISVPQLRKLFDDLGAPLKEGDHKNVLLMEPTPMMNLDSEEFPYAEGREFIFVARLDVEKLMELQRTNQIMDREHYAIVKQQCMYWELTNL
jgi:hypothetical protein